ncbi:hypothetical protein K491DRAFT_711522 [Lophiostoma macrostomum CBS 122681]|uniref:J domain-containing protein n=1 Tax=Lophiostoma macrostomum CBS 122681 TaxID=1314788 RepID=A0A6A6TME0_9PLEO|nr:hypothetical protein K491DRAFT_711522 [Lophiostoma macrostomum CBS 122681]
MLSKKPAVLLSSYSSLPSLTYGPAHSSTSCRSSPAYARRYAQHASEPHTRPPPPPQLPGDETDLAWPEPLHPHTAPTPYQILALRRGDVYTKRRFYALAKIYHPDRQSQPSSPVAHLPSAVRTERYRLLVAAHDIFCDESKRRAYDLWGHGWTGHHHSTPNDVPFEWRPTTRQWPSEHDPMRNATWEDWERWYDREYQREKGEDPHATYMSNFGFMSLIFALVSIGGVVQGTRANVMTYSVMEQRDRVHKDASIELQRSKHATMTGDRGERIRTFLEHREATLARDERLPPPSESCSPDSIGKQ